MMKLFWCCFSLLFLKGSSNESFLQYIRNDSIISQRSLQSVDNASPSNNHHHHNNRHHSSHDQKEPLHLRLSPSQHYLFDIRRVFPSAIVGNDPNLFTELQLYVEQHHRDVVLNDPSFCNRTFLQATYGGPQMIGNRIHEFLNGLLTAFVTNRTVYWAFCERKLCKWDTMSDFDSVIIRHPWMLSRWDFEQAWKDRQCSGTLQAYELIGQYWRPGTEAITMCCGLDRLDSVIRNLNIGNHELHQLFSLSLPNAHLLYPSARYRSKLLFRNGEEYGYGILFRMAFQIKSALIEQNNHLIQQHLQQYYPEYSQSSDHLLPPFYISIHIRHATNTDTKELQDNSAHDCLHKIIPKFYHHLRMVDPQASSNSSQNRPCIILLAADRNESLQYWFPYKVINQKVNCSILMTEHTGAHISWNEHGPFTGEISIRDLDLLSRGEILLGSSYLMQKLTNLVSSFSLLSAALRATNGLEYATKYEARYIPDCERVIAAARKPLDIFVKKSMDCKQVGDWMPPACPYAKDHKDFQPLV